MISLTRRIQAIRWSFFVPALLAATASAQDFTILTSGPLHEGYASPVVFDSAVEASGFNIDVDPPRLIEEIAPVDRPVGYSEWVPGYWSFDDDRRNWTWVTGSWRVAPPGRTWVPGYWTRTPGGWRWVAGYWALASTEVEIDYLPQPPAPQSVVAIGQPPAADAIWVPGTWIWTGTDYVWREGYWVHARPDWIWIPAHYVWTPHGYVFIDGYWDYVVARRGIVFAPVFFPPAVYANVGFRFSPDFVINIALFADSFFVRPIHHHYYFGDYYADTWWSRGIYPAFSFHLTRYGYDPVFAYQSWRFGRGDSRWLEERRTHFLRLREREQERPPRTLDEVAKRPAPAPIEGAEKAGPVAVALKDVTQVTPIRLERTPEPERERVMARVNAKRQAREERVKIETKGANGAANGAGAKPRKEKIPTGAAPSADAARAPAPDVPERPQVPKVEPGRRPEPRPEAGPPDEPSVERKVDHLGQRRREAGEDRERPRPDRPPRRRPPLSEGDRPGDRPAPDGRPETRRPDGDGPPKPDGQPPG